MPGAPSATQGAGADKIVEAGYLVCAAGLPGATPHALPETGDDAGAIGLDNQGRFRRFHTMYLGSGGINGAGAVSFGPPDSGGAGYRLQLAPNP